MVLNMKNINISDIADGIQLVLAELRNWLDIPTKQIESTLGSIFTFLESFLQSLIDSLSHWFHSFKSTADKSIAPILSGDIHSRPANRTCNTDQRVSSLPRVIVLDAKGNNRFVESNALFL